MVNLLVIWNIYFNNKNVTPIKQIIDQCQKSHQLVNETITVTDVSTEVALINKLMSLLAKLTKFWLVELYFLKDEDSKFYLYLT